jgi:DNA-binding NtrC family response regulator
MSSDRELEEQQSRKSSGDDLVNSAIFSGSRTNQERFAWYHGLEKTAASLHRGCGSNAVVRRRTRVLIVEDDEAIREVLRMRLADWGFAVRLATNAEEAERKAKRSRPEIVLSDIVLPGLSGIDLLRILKAGDPSRSVVLITAHGTVDMAVEAMREGARDFLIKPLDYRKLRAILGEIQSELKAHRSTRDWASGLAKRSARFGEFVGASRSMRRVYRMIKAVAATEVPVLITGGSGTGKELAARTIHLMGRRSGKPFVAVNAAAIPKELMESEIFGHEKGAFTGASDLRRGCFELADRGTLFLDEIAEMPLSLQPKLLRVLEDGRVRRVGGSKEIRVDARLLAATNQEPTRAVQDGRLREDLFHRLNVLTVPLPELQRRRNDIPLLAHHFLAEFNLKHGRKLSGFRPESLGVLSDYAWPGNVRELRNVVERAVVLSTNDWIESSDLPPRLRGSNRDPSDEIVLPVGSTLAEAEKELILRTLEDSRNNKAEAARRLGVSVRTVRNKLKRFALQ